ncbi:MAG: sulfite exporter TauE/SafE family protein, partial [bacterium]
MAPEYTLAEWALILAAAVGDGFLLRTFGAGVGITLLPLLTLAFPPRFALALIALYSTMASWGMVRDLWAEWDRRTVYVLMPGLVAGTFIGAWVLTWLTDLRLRQVIGLVCLLFALERLIAEFRRRPVRAGRFPLWAGAGLGVFSGFSSALANTGATILVPFLIAQRFSKAATLGTL